MNGSFMPIGSVIGLHKDISTPAIEVPDGWVGCDGQVLDDVDSLLHGLTMPSLNTDGRFLRGRDISGVEEESAVKNHTHATAIGSHSHTPRCSASAANHCNPSGRLAAAIQPTSTLGYRAPGTVGTMHSWAILATNLGTKTSGNPSGGNVEGRPINMSIYFIIKVREVDIDIIETNTGPITTLNGNIGSNSGAIAAVGQLTGDIVTLSGDVTTLNGTVTGHTGAIGSVEKLIGDIANSGTLNVTNQFQGYGADVWHYVGADGEPELNAEGWTMPSPNLPLRFMKDGNIVFLQGKGYQYHAGNTLFTLPEGYRPSQEIYIPVRSSGQDVDISSVVIYPTGDVNVWNPYTGERHVWFDNCVFNIS